MPYHSRSDHSSQGSWRPECAICKESVYLEESSADEHGHEDCYVSNIGKPMNKFTV